MGDDMPDPNDARLSGEGGQAVLFKDAKGRMYRRGPAQAGECQDCHNWRLLRAGICLSCRGEVEVIRRE